MDVDLSSELDDPLPTQWLVDLAEVVMKAESLPGSAQLSLTLVSEERMSELNAEHMGKAAPTDVLSFPIEDFAAGPVVPDPEGPPMLLGDVVICPDVVKRNAKGAGVAFEDEMALMVVHGILHLLGRDHQIDEEAEAMEQREQEILAMVGRQRP